MTNSNNPFWQYRRYKQTLVLEYLEKIRPAIVELIDRGLGMRLMAEELRDMGFMSISGKRLTEYNLKTVLNKLNLKTVFQAGGEA